MTVSATWADTSPFGSRRWTSPTTNSPRAVLAWDNDFRIECQGDDVTVHSAGPDGSPGTEDDI